ncbi:MAG: type II 3-dehydroquinate dehydratase [Myxococcales bacterium]|nr:type II 3-dehydroquinate dehydratase [Myxococcales bacterium]
MARARLWRIEVLHGPNLNRLGTREPALYGRATLAEIDARLHALGRELGADVGTFQSNHEGALIDRLHAQGDTADAFILNLAGYTHTSVALRDAVLAVGVPAVEVHLTNAAAREPFRRVSLLTGVAIGSIAGLGALGYELALRALIDRLQTGAESAGPQHFEP